MGHVFHGGEIGWSVLGADAAFVIPEDHVHDPVHAFHRPMAADDRLCRQEQQGCDVEARLELGFSAAFARALDHDAGFQARPVVTFLEPGDIVDHGCGAGFDAIAINSLVPADRRIPEAVSFLFGPSTSSRRVP